MKPFNRLTRLLCSLLGMVFMGSGLLVGLWAGVDIVTLTQSVLLSGLVGAGLGFILGRALTFLLSEWVVGKIVAQEEGKTQKKDLPPENGEAEKQFQSWNPPRIDRDINHGG